MILIFCLLAYLIGSIPFGIVWGKVLGKEDLRSHGSKNIGATNAFRVGGTVFGFLTFLSDFLKGVIAVQLAMQLSDYHNFDSNIYAGAIAAFFVVFGHVFPIWLKFHGGKGVATAAGAIIAIDISLGLTITAAWIISFALTRISSLSALVACAVAVLFAALEGQPHLIMLTLTLALLIGVRHKDNIKRLMKREEQRM